MEMHPFCLRHLPRRGRFALHSAFVLISISKHNAAKTSPSGGSGAQHPKGGALPTDSIYIAPDRAPLQPSDAKRLSILRTLGAKAPSIFRTLSLPLAFGNTVQQSSRQPSPLYSFSMEFLISSNDLISTSEMSFLNFSSCSATSGASFGNWGLIFFSACRVMRATT